jgi:hypothetical protein
VKRARISFQAFFHSSRSDGLEIIWYAPYNNCGHQFRRACADLHMHVHSCVSLCVRACVGRVGDNLAAILKSAAAAADPQPTAILKSPAADTKPIAADAAAACVTQKNTWGARCAVLRVTDSNRLLVVD